MSGGGMEPRIQYAKTSDGVRIAYAVALRPPVQPVRVLTTRTQSVVIFTSSICSEPPLTMLPITNPTPGAKYLCSTTSGSRDVKSSVTTTSLYEPADTVVDSLTLSTLAMSSASPG